MKFEMCWQIVIKLPTQWHSITFQITWILPNVNFLWMLIQLFLSHYTHTWYIILTLLIGYNNDNNTILIVIILTLLIVYDTSNNTHILIVIVLML